MRSESQIGEIGWKALRSLRIHINPQTVDCCSEPQSVIVSERA